MIINIHRYLHYAVRASSASSEYRIRIRLLMTILTERADNRKTLSSTFPVLISARVDQCSRRVLNAK